MQKPVFSILITTKNRILDLKLTLIKIDHLIISKQVECIICDDGSVDGTHSIITKEFPNIILLRNSKSIGLIASRNRLLKETSSKYAISLDDDSNFLTLNPLNIIENYFNANPNCGVVAFRILWGKELPQKLKSEDVPCRVKSFVGCGHAWRMDAWRDIPNYPEWYIFYGEEEFASYQLFKKDWQVHYVPQVLVHHRVEVSNRKSQEDYKIRLRRSLRSGWYNYVLFLPWLQIPKRFLYTFYMQLKLKVFKGDFKATLAIFQALLDLIYHFPKLILNNNRLTKIEYKEFENLSNTKIYWKPKYKIDV
ncbi:glycosyltransferase family 2 protein [Gillisia sp. CAL575]|uniref:glycosyltransferase family 2 protein n=1 Tax=Gillisia sp. CAL575 TaxID=985255 RepID=UPI0003A7B747|nr:glycosyltransferase [Gillisia sp. CAL575]